MPPVAITHVPHASVVIPTDLRNAFRLSDDELDRELLRMTDRYTDELFELPAEMAVAIASPVSRLVVDPERFVDDVAEPMAARGMGVLYTHTSQRELMREVTPAMRAALLARFYVPHHERLASAVDASLAAHGAALVVDCHSFASTPLPHEPDQAASRPEICLGTDRFHTPPSLVDAAHRLFAEAGFTVERDRPFAGAMVPAKHYQRDPRVSAIMVEVNRGLYMDERTGSKLAGFRDVQAGLQRTVGRIIETWASAKPRDQLPPSLR